jgi:hypothetical protein
MKKWRSHLRTPHFDAAHVAEFAALIVALAAGLSVDAIACRLLRVLDDDDPWGAGQHRSGSAAASAHDRLTTIP